MAIPEDLSAQWDVCSHDLHKFRRRISALFLWGYALLIVGLLTLAAGYFYFIIVFAVSLLVCGIFMGNRSDRLHVIIETHQARYNSPNSTSHLRTCSRFTAPPPFAIGRCSPSSFTSSKLRFLRSVRPQLTTARDDLEQVLRDRWLCPHDHSNKVKSEHDAPGNGHDKGSKQYKPFSPSAVLGRLESEISQLKERADSVYGVAVYIYLIVIIISLPIVECCYIEKIGGWCFLWLFAFVPTYRMPFSGFRMICLELLLTLLQEIPLLTETELIPKSVVAIIGIAAIAAYRI